MGQELTRDITPVEAGIGFAVKHKKESDFFGKSVLSEQKENGAKPRKLVGLEMIEKEYRDTDMKCFKAASPSER